MISFFLLHAKSDLFRFTNNQIPSGYVIQRWMDVEGGVLEQNFSFLQCKGSCHLELFIFPESIRSQVFTNNPEHQPICCDETMKNCLPEYIVYNNKTDVIQRTFQIDGEPVSENEKTKPKRIKNPIPNDSDVKINLSTASLRGQEMIAKNYPGALSLSDKREIYSVVLANCGEKPFVLNGYIKIHSENGYMDLRLTSFKFIIILITLAGIIGTAAWFHFITKKRPKLTTQHYLFIGSAVFYSLHFLVHALSFFIWNHFGNPMTIGIILASIFRAAAFTGLLYCTITGLQYPLEIQYYPFGAVLLLVSLSSFVDLSGIAHINGRQNGRWLFGFGAVPFLDFLVVSISSMMIAIITIKQAPEETNEDERRNNFLKLFIGSFGAYALISIAIVIVTLSYTTVQRRFIDTIAILISPAYLTALVAMNGYFWFQFNPNGWVNANDGNFDDDDNDLGILDQDPVEYAGTAEPSLIPDVPIKKSGKKKKSDDDFDIDDSFSGSGNIVQIEKID